MRFLYYNEVISAVIKQKISSGTNERKWLFFSFKLVLKNVNNLRSKLDKRR